MLLQMFMLFIFVPVAVCAMNIKFAGKPSRHDETNAVNYDTYIDTISSPSYVSVIESFENTKPVNLELISLKP